MSSVRLCWNRTLYTTAAFGWKEIIPLFVLSARPAQLHAAAGGSCLEVTPQRGGQGVRGALGVSATAGGSCSEGTPPAGRLGHKGGGGIWAE